MEETLKQIETIDVDTALELFIEQRERGGEIVVRDFLDRLGSDRERLEFRELLQCIEESEHEIRADEDELPMVLGGKFQLVAPVGKGGFGEVWRAIDTDLDCEVAIKIVECRDEAAWERGVVREARLLASLDAPGIVPVKEIGRVDERRGYLVMKLLRGDTLIARVGERRRGDVVADRGWWLRVAYMMIEAAEAVQHAHEAGVLHRDLKPGNVFELDDCSIVVLDFGLAGRADRAEGSLSGTKPYMPPEALATYRAATEPTADVYQLGLILYELLTGRTAYRNDDEKVLDKIKAGDFEHPRACDARIPRALEDICRRAIALRVEDRYQSARAFADDLERFVGGRMPRATRDRAGSLSWTAAGYAAWQGRFAIALLVVLVAVGLVASRWEAWTEERVTIVPHETVRSDVPLGADVTAPRGAGVYALAAIWEGPGDEPALVRPFHVRLERALDDGTKTESDAAGLVRGPDGAADRPVEPRRWGSWGCFLPSGRWRLSFAVGDDDAENTRALRDAWRPGRSVGAYVFVSEQAERMAWLEDKLHQAEEAGLMERADGWLPRDLAESIFAELVTRGTGGGETRRLELHSADSWIGISGVRTERIRWGAPPD